MKITNISNILIRYKNCLSYTQPWAGVGTTSCFFSQFLQFEQSMENGFLKGLTASLEKQAKQSMMEVCRKADDAKKKMDSFLELIGKKRWRE